MSQIDTMLAGYGVALSLPAAVIAALSAPMRSVMLDLCGTEARAAFWTAYLRILLTLAPLLGVSTVFVGSRELAGMVDAIPSIVFWSVLGMVVALLVIGWMIHGAIPARRAGAAPETAPPAEG